MAVVEAAAVELAKIGVNLAKDELMRLLKGPKSQYTQTKSGGEWYSCVDGEEGYVLSAYYHPSKWHTATTVGRLG